MISKKIFSRYKQLIIYLFLFQTITVFGQNAPITSAESMSICPNETFNIAITVSDFSQITALSLRLDFDPTLLAYNGFSNLNNLLSGCIVNMVPVSSNLTKILIVWSNVNPLTLDDGSLLVDLNFTHLLGSPIISFNNTANSGGDCEFADANGDPLNDMPTSIYYINASLTNIGAGEAGTIDGTATLCQGASNVPYTIPPIANATDYIWAFSGTGATINGSSNSITINFANNASSGNLSVFGTNSCGNGTVSSDFPIVLNSVPTADAGDDQSIPNGTSTTLNGSASGGSGSFTWHWEPSNLLLDPDVQSPTTLSLTTSVLFTLTVSDSYACNSYDEVFINVSGPLTITATANPETICVNEMVQLAAFAGGGSGNYSYFWTSEPVGFTSDMQNPVAYPLVNTIYSVEVNDGVTTINDEVSVTVNQLPIVPEMPIGPDIVDLKDIVSSDYTIASVPYSDTFIWELLPETAGVITGSETSGTVVWNPGFLGYAYIKVQSVNTCGQSDFSLEKQTFVDNTIGINQSELPSIVIFPNPSDGIFHIKSSQSIDKIIIRDLPGNSIIEIDHPNENYRLNSNLTAGIFFVQVFINDYELIKKVVIQKSR
jgi:hypothetical protein